MNRKSNDLVLFAEKDIEVFKLILCLSNDKMLQNIADYYTQQSVDLFAWATAIKFNSNFKKNKTTTKQFNENRIIKLKI